MDSHLVAIEIRVESRTYQRMQLNRLAFDQYRLKCLDTKTVQCRCTVQQYRVLTDYFRKNIPDLGTLCFYQLFGCFNGRRHATQLQFAENKRLE